MANSNLEKIESAIAGADDLTVSRPATGPSSRWDRIRGYGMTVAGMPVILPIGMYCEFFESVVITPLPNSPAYFAGLTNIRGNVVPVYDLAQFIASDASQMRIAYQNVKIVQLGKGEDAAAIICEQAPRTFDLTVAVETKVSQALPEAVHSWISRSLVVDGREWHELNYLSLFQSLAGR